MFDSKPRIFNNKDAKTNQRIDGNFPAAKRHKSLKIETRIIHSTLNWRGIDAAPAHTRSPLAVTGFYFFS
jgi:hypothetical protein